MNSHTYEKLNLFACRRSNKFRSAEVKPFQSKLTESISLSFLFCIWSFVLRNLWFRKKFFRSYLFMFFDTWRVLLCSIISDSAKKLLVNVLFKRHSLSNHKLSTSADCFKRKSYLLRTRYPYTIKIMNKTCCPHSVPSSIEHWNNICFILGFLLERLCY